ncbi:hypothetical protein SteCoe_26715 [Stentor coeruleus]|uniref:RING-type domain-containing protein n=1 Tax=Stentor coeruleus TaxID=5963 RepID=A0A1R2BC80_9CILI|nr:hypothetical protein SteCoe_26715 [Stentor coeruleus]
MEQAFCEYCSLAYNFTNRLPLCLNCGHTFCQSCYTYLNDLAKQSYCPFCNTFEEPNCYDKNIIDSIANAYLCMWHNLPIKYFNEERAFACQVCKNENPNLTYNSWSGNIKEEVNEQMRTFKFEREIERNILLVRKQLEEKLQESLEKKKREIERIKKEYKDKKAEIKKLLKLLNEASRKYSENNEFLELQLNINLLCLLAREKSQENVSRQEPTEKNLSEKLLSIDSYNEFRDECREWKNLWDKDIYILFKSFSKISSKYEIYIKRNLIINIKKPFFGESKPRNLIALGLCLPTYKRGFGKYTILSIQELNKSDNIDILNQLNPIKVEYDKSNYTICNHLPQDVILFEETNYLLTYEYFGSPTYLGVVPKIVSNGLTYSHFYLKGNFICSESQIVYLVMTG